MPRPSDPMTRRAALRMLAASAASDFVLPPGSARAAGAAEHPDPRPGITSEKVLDDPDFRPKVAEVYRMAREAPEVFDGLHCYCECHKGQWGHRSLLTCFESRQPDGCHGCQTQARLAYRLHKEGKTLEEIRAAVDKEFA